MRSWYMLAQILERIDAASEWLNQDSAGTTDFGRLRQLHFCSHYRIEHGCENLPDTVEDPGCLVDKDDVE